MTDDVRSTRLGDLLGSERASALTKTVSEVAGKTGALAHCGPLLAGAVEQAVGAALDMDVLGVLADAWTTANDIRDLQAKAQPGSVAIVKLGKHSIASTLKPVVHVAFGAETDVMLDIGIVLTGTFQGIELSVGQAGILAVGSGTCDLSMDVQLAGRSLSDDKTLASWKLPGEHRFAPPIGIP